jgi:hypothetical protein
MTATSEARKRDEARKRAGTRNLRRQDVTNVRGAKLERWWCDCHIQRAFTSQEAANDWHERQP